MQSESDLPQVPPDTGVAAFAALPPWPSWQPRLAARVRRHRPDRAGGAVDELLLTTESMTAAIGELTGRSVHVRWTAGAGRAPVALDTARPPGWLRYATLYAGSEPVLVACSWFPRDRGRVGERLARSAGPLGARLFEEHRFHHGPLELRRAPGGWVRRRRHRVRVGGSERVLEFVVAERLLPVLDRY